VGATGVAPFEPQDEAPLEDRCYPRGARAPWRLRPSGRRLGSRGARGLSDELRPNSGLSDELRPLFGRRLEAVEVSGAWARQAHVQRPVQVNDTLLPDGTWRARPPAGGASDGGARKKRPERPGEGGEEAPGRGEGGRVGVDAPGHKDQQAAMHDMARSAMETMVGPDAAEAREPLDPRERAAQRQQDRDFCRSQWATSLPPPPPSY